MSQKSQVKPNPQPSPQPPMSFPVKGLDVSHYSGELDWQKLYGLGYRFMFAKATEGQNVIDKTFYTNWNKANEAGLFTGAYHFFHPNQDVMQQYHNFMFTAGKLRSRDIGFALDLEVTNNMDNDFVKKQALQWLDLVEKESGRTPIVYLSPGFAEQINLQDTPEFSRFPLWVANYGVSKPHVPAPWKTWDFWQYSETPMDFDYWNGTLSDLKAFAVP